MPKDEFDFEDPLELNGVAFLTHEDTTETMCECFVEEFLRMGYGPRQIIALFRNPHYLGMNLVLEKRGEAFVAKPSRRNFRGGDARWIGPQRVGRRLRKKPGRCHRRTLLPSNSTRTFPTPRGRRFRIS